MSAPRFEKPRIVFMGTPEFAVASLEALLQAGYNVVGVVTAPDKPAGRGMKLQMSAVKQYALGAGLNVLQPEKLRSPDFLETLRSMQADMQVVVAFRMLPEVVWNMPPMGTINVHGSLLPQYRGAAPINWAIINGESQTGVTTFRLQHAIDTGDILLQAALPIGPDETAGELHDRMKTAGAELLVQTVEGLRQGTLKARPQNSLAATEALRHAPRIYTDDCRLSCDMSAVELHNRIRGLSPYPGAFTELGGKMLKIYRSTVTPGLRQPGEGYRFSSDGKTFLRMRAADGCINLTDVQLEGKKRLPVEEFLRGLRMEHYPEIELESAS